MSSPACIFGIESDESFGRPATCPLRFGRLEKRMAKLPQLSVRNDERVPWSSAMAGDRAMPDAMASRARLLGRDAAHRTRNLDTHLTHGCIQLFRHFSGSGCDGATHALSTNVGFLPFFEPPQRCSGGAVP